MAGGSAAEVRFTTVDDGDLQVARDPAELGAARRAVLDLPWSWLHQVHGADVVVVGAPGSGAGSEADALVTTVPSAPLAIHTADCAPVALVSPEGVIGAVHAGWRGLLAGVVEAAVERMGSAGARRVHAVLGPCIGPECYAFGPGELDAVAGRLGGAVRGVTAAGGHALDLRAAVRAALRPGQRAPGGPPVTGLDVVEACTGCDDRFFSHRARGDRGRQALLVWLLPPGDGGAVR